MRNVWKLLALVVCALPLAGRVSGQDAPAAQVVKVEPTTTFDLAPAGTVEISVTTVNGRRETTFTLKSMSQALLVDENHVGCGCWRFSGKGRAVWVETIIPCTQDTDKCCEEWRERACPMPPAKTKSTNKPDGQ